MTERPETEKALIDSLNLKASEIADSKFKLIDRVILDFAPEIAYIYQIREDKSEEQQIKTGRLHENRILGIFLKFYLEGKKKITTGDVEEEYRLYFREIARSTTSTYLNMLKNESILSTEKDGRKAYYFLHEDPPLGIKPFWFTRIFCIVPVYFNRAMTFSHLYINPEKAIQDYVNQYGGKDKKILVKNFKFIIGLILLNIFKNRSSKCILCQFSKREIYEKLEEIISIAIKDRTDVLPEDLVNNVINKYSEIPTLNETDNDIMEEITTHMSRYADIYKRDIEFQVMLSVRRQDLRLKQKRALEGDMLSVLIEEKIERGV
ncbi:MAG: hypothetical protein CEE43_18505 [Promethearchaeota archaeon Loki_b32]|nr:MAG: hypothetical protein CEE43_18505 [Candidatus Lokiarchaeota archaeon Loki_b32]